MTPPAPPSGPTGGPPGAPPGGPPGGAPGTGRPGGVELALIAPDMAPNVGAAIRLAACLGLVVHVVEPCGFPFSPRAWARQAMDYADLARIEHHAGWAAFAAAISTATGSTTATSTGPTTETGGPRLVALSARAETPLHAHAFRPGDVLMLGAETAGLDARALAAAAVRLRIPLAPGARSLNVVTAGAIAAAEALRQLGAPPFAPA
ncbi:MAG: TrmH family RNA methyltransferase [Pseudomonadota bacterium]